MNFKAKDFISNPEQLAYARSSVLNDGPGNGQRIIDVFNGRGLACTVTPDRGLNIVECSCFGIPLVYRTPAGHQHPTGIFQQDWVAGLLTTCGLHNIGAPSMDEPQHGRISQKAAKYVAVKHEEDKLVVTGELCEGWLFGPGLKLARTLTFSTKENTILLEDTVTNLAPQADDLAILYHCNFGYPLITPETVLEAPEHPLEPRDEIAAAGLADWNTMSAPVPDYREQCFRHKLPAGKDGMAGMKIVNRALGMAVTVSYDPSTIRHMVQWKNCMTNCYVLGLEPGVGSLLGRAYDLKNNQLHHLESGEQVSFKVRFQFEKI